LHYPFADLAILSSAYANRKKMIIYKMKRGFLWGMYRKRG